MLDAAHAAPRLVGGARHAPAQQRLEGDRKQRRLVPPVLEQPPRRRVRGAVEQRGVVRAEPTEQRQVVRALKDVHRVDLEQRDAVEHASQRPAVRRAVPRRVREALRRQRDAAGLRGGEALDRSATDGHGGASCHAATTATAAAWKPALSDTRHEPAAMPRTGGAKTEGEHDLAGCRRRG
jgi:hypothetical protein